MQIIDKDTLDFWRDRYTKKLGSQQFQFICSSCGEVVHLSLYSIKKSNYQLLCKKCKIINTCQDRYGVSNPMKTSQVQKKIKQNNLKKYGVENPMQSSKVQRRIRETWLEKYGVDHPWKLRENRKKIKNTLVRKYGVENPLQSLDIKKKVQNTNQKRYGTTCVLQNESIKNKIKKTNLKRYGVENPFQNSDIQHKIQQKNLQKYQNKCSVQNPEIQKKARETCIRRYGFPYPIQNSQFRRSLQKKYVYEGISFDSKWEIIFYKYCIDNGFNIIPNPCKIPYVINNKTHYYYPDFEVDGQLIEIKGDHFFNENGDLYNPYNGDLWLEKQQCMIDHEVVILTYKDLKDILKQGDL